MLTQILTWIYFNEELKSVLKARKGLKENINTFYFQILISLIILTTNTPTH